MAKGSLRRIEAKDAVPLLMKLARQGEEGRSVIIGRWALAR